jgi:hypothetical protein
MLKRLLLVLDVLLVAAAVALAVHLYQIWTAAPATAGPTPAPAAATAVPEAPAGAQRAAAGPPAAFLVIADRNLFSPTRAEVLPDPPKPPTVNIPTIATRPIEKPRLYGVVIGTDGARAYLWDPQSKKVFGYKVGDSVAESRIEQISADRVVLRRSAETFEVLLRDPSKPKPPPQPAAPPGPGPGQAGIPPGALTAPGAQNEGEGPPLVPGVPTAPMAPPSQGPAVGVPGPTPPRRPGLPGFVPGRPPLRAPQGTPGAGSQPVPVEPPQSGDAGS